MNELDLIQMAIAASKNAHCPYSDYPVGSALLGSDGKVYVGCNFENASYGLSICAERNAIGAMVVAGCKNWRTIVVVTKDGGPPCGACLQVLSEFASDGNEKITMCNGSKKTTEMTLNQLLPVRFSL